MWFLLLAMGALALAAFGLPATQRLAFPPPPEALLAAYFLLAALIRLLVRDFRLASFERKARRLARRTTDKPPSMLGELGAGVGRGALHAVGGDLLGAGIALASALMRGAASSVNAPPPPVRERRRAGTWERVKALACVAGVGLVCAGAAWEPLVRGRWHRAAEAAAVAAGLKDPPATGAAAMTAVRRPTPTATAAPSPLTSPREPTITRGE